MANEDIKAELEKLKQEDANALERQNLNREMQKYKARKWERQHPRLARLRNIFNRGGW